MSFSLRLPTSHGVDDGPENQSLALEHARKRYRGRWLVSSQGQHVATRPGLRENVRHTETTPGDTREAREGSRKSPNGRRRARLEEVQRLSPVRELQVAGWYDVILIVWSAGGTGTGACCKVNLVLSYLREPPSRACRGNLDIYPRPPRPIAKDARRSRTRVFGNRILMSGRCFAIGLATLKSGAAGVVEATQGCLLF